MKFIGIDLAWSEGNPSGAAIIDDEGVLVRASGNICSNQELWEFTGLNGSEDAIVAIDAPLIVNNPTGQRPVERQLTEIFGPYDAGPHSANLSNPMFQETGRIQQFVWVCASTQYSETSTAAGFRRSLSEPSSSSPVPFYDAPRSSLPFDHEFDKERF